MKKLKLNLDDLKVESFSTLPTKTQSKGTAFANATVLDPTCEATCADTCASTCDASCNGTCDASCNGTCVLACDQTEVFCGPTDEQTCYGGCITEYCTAGWETVPCS